MITLTHVSNRLPLRVLRPLIVGILLAGGSARLGGQSDSRSLIAPRLPGDRLLLWGAFDIQDRPVLEFTQLVRRGEIPRAPAGYPSFSNHVDGSVRLRLPHQRHVEGSWARVRRAFTYGTGSLPAGWGWIATVAYAPGASGYTLSRGKQNLGGEVFPASPDKDRSRTTLSHRLVGADPVTPDDTYLETDLTGPGMYLDGHGAPTKVERCWWSLESPHGQPPHGTWMQVLPKDPAKPNPLLRQGTVRVAWPAFKGHEQLPQSSAQVLEWEPDSEWTRCFNLIVDLPIAYPWRRSAVLRRSFGLQVLEEVLPLEINAQPPLEADNP